MRGTVILLAALTLGCSADTTVPRRVSARGSVALSNTAGDTSVAALGDSAIATVSLPYTCSGAVTAIAGVSSARLYVTITDSLQWPVPCANLAAYRIYRAAVGPLSAGTYPVELRFRDVVAGSVSESVVLRSTVRIP